MAGKSTSLAERAAGGQNHGCLALFFSVFLLAGLGFAVPILGWPLWRFAKARSWQPVPCTIESSSVGTHSSSDGDPTYSVDVTYRYTVDGTSHSGDRYRFVLGSSSGYDGKAAAVASLPPGMVTECWVDPANPADSVLQRRLGWELLFGLIPLTFVAVGGGGVLWSLRSGMRERRKRRAGAAALGAPWAAAGGATMHELAQELHPIRPKWLPEPPGRPVGQRGSVTLEPRHGPMAKLVGTLFVALFWNGIVSVFLWQVVKSWRSGSPDGCLTIFLVPFVLIGVALLGAVPYQILATFNPRPRLTFSAATVPVGGAARVHWEFVGAAGRLRTVKIWLEGHEEATYRRGTNTRTERRTFATIPVIEVAAPAPLDSGEAALSIPAGTMHSFAGEHNKVAWTLKLRGEIARWPDVSEDFEIVVEPRRVSS